MYLTKPVVSSNHLAKHYFKKIFWQDCLHIDNQRSRSRTGWSAVLLKFRGGEWSPWEQEPPEALLQSHLWRASRTRSRMRWAVWDWTPSLSSGVRSLPREGASSEFPINWTLNINININTKRNFWLLKTWGRPCITFEHFFCINLSIPCENPWQLEFSCNTKTKAFFVSLNEYLSTWIITLLFLLPVFRDTGSRAVEVGPRLILSNRRSRGLSSSSSQT